MVGEPESGTIWWDLSGPGRLQPPRAPPPMSGKQCPADSVAGPGLETPRPLLSSFPEVDRRQALNIYIYVYLPYGIAWDYTKK